MRRRDQLRALLSEPPVPLHAWQRCDARSTRCRACGLRAHVRWDGHKGVAYVVWAWRNLIWDSHDSAVPTCPPSYRRERGVNPRVVVRPGEGVRGVDR